VIKPLVIDQTTTAATLQQVLKMTYELLGINQSVPEYSNDDVLRIILATQLGMLDKALPATGLGQLLQTTLIHGV
jgi:hypothetical protein